jgi:hypothetical protein
MISKTALPSITGLGRELVDETDDVVEPAASAGADAASGKRVDLCQFAALEPA